VAQPVVHFEISGRDPAALRAYYAELFGWEYDTDSPVAPGVSDPGDYGFIDQAAAGGIPGGIGGGSGHPAQSLFYVGVPDVAAALAEAERLGGKRVLGPEKNPAGHLVVAHFTDPEGNLIGLAGPA
jgi:hypothetical protein